MTATLSDGVSIFLFHGVIPATEPGVRNYTRKHMTVAAFTAILDRLCRAGTPVSMPAVVAATLAGAPLPSPAFAVTFDDGFENNVSIAAPLLEARGVPATFYVTTQFVDANAASWIDRIEFGVERAEPACATLPGAVAPSTLGTPQNKIAFLDDVRRIVKADRRLDPYAVADALLKELGVTFETDPMLDQKMTWTQVRDVAHHRLFTVGGHGHTHRILEFLDDAHLEGEVTTSLRLLREYAGVRTQHYSYPEGLAHCYSDRVIGVLRRHGIVCAPTAEPGVNRIGDDLFRLKRIA